MAVRKPFKLKDRPTYYAVVNGRRFSLETSDPAVAEQKYIELMRKEGAPWESGVRLAAFRRDFLGTGQFSTKKVR